MTRHNCRARRYADQIICEACGLNWDANDPDPPECRKIAKLDVDASPVMPHRYGQGRCPEQLPSDLALEMVKVFRANGGGPAAMQAAYRLFLDRMGL